MDSQNARQVILLVEDDPDDRQLMAEAAGEAGIALPLRSLEDADQLAALLFPHDHAAVTVQPVLILLDLNLPGGGGRSTLERLKQSEEYKRTPVLVFTTSAVKEEIAWAYSMGANSLMIKPFSFHELVDILRVVKAYWFETVELP